MPWINKDATIEEIRAAFAADKFATIHAGTVIDDAGFQRATCSMKLSPEHLNAQGIPMGGAIFTLADFCLAIISNIGEEPTSSISSSIDFLAASRGSVLRAEGRVLKSGHRIGFYAIDVWDNLDVHIASMSATCYRRPLQNG